jgi:hypothetical protein
VVITGLTRDVDQAIAAGRLRLLGVAAGVGSLTAGIRPDFGVVVTRLRTRVGLCVELGLGRVVATAIAARDLAAGVFVTARTPSRQQYAA